MNPYFKDSSAIILAGGNGVRIGMDKAFLRTVSGQSLVGNAVDILCSRFEEVVVSSNRIESLVPFGLPVVPDEKPGQGPLMGIYSAMRRTSNPYNFVLSVDTPCVNLGFVEKLLGHARVGGYDIVVPGHGGFYEPLFAVYHKRALRQIERLFAEGKNKISCLFSLCTVKVLEEDISSWHMNINTREDYSSYLGNQSAGNGYVF